MTRPFSMLLVLATLALPTWAQTPSGRSIVSVSETVQALDAEQKAQAIAALQILSVNCPYTRSALQLPYALHTAVMRIDPGRLGPSAQRDWTHLRDGLSTHVSVLEALGVDLAEPNVDDHLYARDPGVVIDRKTLQSSKDPIGATSVLVGQITQLAGNIDQPTTELIELHSTRLEKATGIERQCPRGPWAVLPGHPWTLGAQLRDWHGALEAVAPLVKDPEAKTQIAAMVELMDAYDATSHAHVGPQ